MQQETEISASQERGIFRSWMGRILIVIVPAIIAGIFSIAPKLYDEFTKPRAVLTYSETSGPAISTENSFRQIFSIAIENAGKLPLTNVDLDVILPPATQIESDAVSQSGGLVPIISKSGVYRAHVERLLPTETIGISLLTASNIPNIIPKVALRSDQVLGAPRTPSLESKEGPVELVLSAILVAMSVGLALFVYAALFIYARRHSSRFRSVLRLPSAGTPVDIIRYIVAVSEIPDFPQNWLFGEHEPTYIGTGDILLYMALNSEKAVREKCVLALKALLAASPETAPESLSAIRTNLTVVGCTVTDAEFAVLRKEADSSKDIAEFRQRMMQFFKSSRLG